MGIYYLDTNALVKLYVFDAASYWTIGIEAQRKPQHRLLVSEIVRAEVPSAMYKIARIDTHVHGAEIELGIRRFKRHLSAATGYRSSRFLVSVLNDAIFNQADALLEKYRTGQPKALHSLDALHLASAIIARNTFPEHDRANIVFVSADKQLRGCAQNEGFAVIDPNNP